MLRALIVARCQVNRSERKKFWHPSLAYLVGLVLHIPGVVQDGVLWGGSHLLHLIQDKGHERGHLGPRGICQLLRTTADMIHAYFVPCIAAGQTGICGGDCGHTPQAPTAALTGPTTKWKAPVDIDLTGGLVHGLDERCPDIIRGAAVWE